MRNFAHAWRRLLGAAPAVTGYALVVSAVYMTGCQAGMEVAQQLTGGGAAIPWRAVFEIVALAGGIAGSWLVSRRTTKHHAKSAFRRLVNLYRGVSEIRQTARQGKHESNARALAVIEALAATHCRTAADTFEDWSDLLPDEVEHLKQSVTEGLEKKWTES